MLFIGLDTKTKMVIIREDSTRMQLLLSPQQAKEIALQIETAAEQCVQLTAFGAGTHGESDKSGGN